MHPSASVSMQSVMTKFQFSPVESLITIMRDELKFLKFLNSLISSPVVTPLKRKHAKTAKMKYTSISREKTFIKAGRENWIVWIKA